MCIFKFNFKKLFNKKLKKVFKLYNETFKLIIWSQLHNRTNQVRSMKKVDFIDLSKTKAKYYAWLHRRLSK